MGMSTRWEQADASGNERTAGVRVGEVWVEGCLYRYSTKLLTALVERVVVEVVSPGHHRHTCYLVGGGLFTMPVPMSPSEMVAAARSARPNRPSTQGEGFTGFIEGCPYVRAFLTEQIKQNGQDRALGSLLFFWGDDVWKACLADRGEGRSVWGQGDSFEEAVSDIESRLKGGTADWRKDRPRGGKR